MSETLYPTFPSLLEDLCLENQKIQNIQSRKSANYAQISTRLKYAFNFPLFLLVLVDLVAVQMRRT